MLRESSEITCFNIRNLNRFSEFIENNINVFGHEGTPLPYFSSAASILTSVFLLTNVSLGAQSAPAAVTAPRAAVETHAAADSRVSSNTLLDGTPVKLRLSQTVTSATAKAGQEVTFEVVEDVQVNGVTVIQKGATALATVTDAEHKKTMGRGGKLNLNIDSVRLVDQQKAQLKATAGGSGGGHTGAMTGAMVATGILFFPAAPLFLFMHGKDITLPKGLETTAFVDGDLKLDMAALTGQPGTSNPDEEKLSPVAVGASVPDCDIELDGVFAGNTPSALSLIPGKHIIVIRKKNFLDWQRTVQVSGTAIRIQADMQPAPATP